uniref:Uncharacterized protein n=1 Tax=Anguilla anguilla TaxID=7936 RepID=A0A0E9WM33_ANGAN
MDFYRVIVLKVCCDVPSHCDNHPFMTPLHFSICCFFLLICFIKKPEAGDLFCSAVK